MSLPKMPNTFRKTAFRIKFASLCLVIMSFLLLVACGLEVRATRPQPPETFFLPSISPQAVTPEIILATNTPVRFSPTHTKSDETPLPTPTGLNIDLLPASSCDKLVVVEDVTVPDGTILEAGTIFVKSWRITNGGECDWKDDISLAYYGGEILSAPTLVKPYFMPVAIAPQPRIGSWGKRLFRIEPGQTVDLALAFKAPDQPGNYISYWALVRETKERIDPLIWVAISVIASSPSSPKDWNGVWSIQDPYVNKPAETMLSLYQQNDTLLGFFYNAYGELILVNGWIDKEGKIAKGEIGQPWQTITKAFSWKLSQDARQFQGMMLNDQTPWCGRKPDAAYPTPCSLADE